MKTLTEVQKLSHLKNRQTVYYRIKALGIEEKEDYKPTINIINGHPMRCFSDEEAEMIIYMKLNKTRDK